jgi:hypothetical protein
VYKGEVGVVDLPLVLDLSLSFADWSGVRLMTSERRCENPREKIILSRNRSVLLRLQNGESQLNVLTQ